MGIYADKRFRPFALRLLMIRLPCFVDIRFINPCNLARFIRLGWYVRFMMVPFNPPRYLAEPRGQTSLWALTGIRIERPPVGHLFGS